MKSLTCRYFISFLSAYVYFRFCLHPGRVYPFRWAHEQTFKQDLDLKTHLLKTLSITLLAFGIHKDGSLQNAHHFQKT